jgi:very-short-patch-repair endonuclease
MTIEEMDKIYDLIRENKSKFIYAKKEEDRNIKLNKFLIEHNIELEIEEITLRSVFEYLTSHWDKKCENEGCENNKKYVGFFPKKDFLPKSYGSYRFCSKKCNYESISKRQAGENNASHRMTEETFKNMCKKNSEKMKKNIKDGKFIPNITNSWANSKCDILFFRNGEVMNLKTRSTWEAYFQIYNPHLLYEKLIIPYKFNREEHNYIVDFVDYNNRIIYEIKPDSTSRNKKNLAKERYARKWCKSNGFKYIMIKNKWFKKNYNVSLVIGQPCEEKLIKNLKQFI